MRTTKISFDYEDKHYTLKIQLKKSNKAEVGYYLSAAPYNECWSLEPNPDEYADTFLAQEWIVNDMDERGYVFELELSKHRALVQHIRVWSTTDNGVLLDDEGAMSNLTIEQKGTE